MESQQCLHTGLVSLLRVTLIISIEYVRGHKFLGVYFDALGLQWNHHIYYIKDSTVNKINLLKSISHHKWGADREILLKLYITLIRSHPDYCSICYDACCKSRINKLNAIQNTCLVTSLLPKQLATAAHSRNM